MPITMTFYTQCQHKNSRALSLQFHTIQKLKFKRFLMIKWLMKGLEWAFGTLLIQIIELRNMNLYWMKLLGFCKGMSLFTLLILYLMSRKTVLEGVKNLWLRFMNTWFASILRIINKRLLLKRLNCKMMLIKRVRERVKRVMRYRI